ncbi:MAG: dihydrofolate reductase family protein [Solirubrobacteraceae bacterium]
MRSLAVVEFLTLDGVMQGFGGPDEDREGGFEYGGWGGPYASEEIGQRAGQGIGATTAYLFGRKTYEHMAAHWPNEPDEDRFARHLNATPKYVVTRTLTSLDWAGSQILHGDVVTAVNELKSQGDGFITVLGSGALAQTLIDHGLIDHYRLFVHPLVLGTGKRLFRETSRPLPMRLVDSAATSTGILMLTYEAVGSAHPNHGTAAAARGSGRE